MPGKRKAPEVIWDYSKDVINDMWGEHYTNYPNEFLYFCLSELDANEFKVFMFLTTVAYGGFLLHKSTALQRTGMKPTKFYEARSQLVDKGWLTLTNGDNPKLIINTRVIRNQYLQHKNEPEVREVVEDEFIF